MGKCDNNPDFECPASEKEREKTCRKTGFCPVTAEGMEKEFGNVEV